MSNQKPLNKDELLHKVNTYINNPYFVYFASSLLQKWETLTDELNKIDQITIIICTRWNITKDELVYHKKHYEPRNLLFFVLKTKMDMSYGDIANMFLKQRENVYKYITETTFLIEKGKKKELIQALESIEKSVTFENETKKNK